MTATLPPRKPGRTRYHVVGGPGSAYEAQRRREYNARQAAKREALRHVPTARGYECPDCHVTGPHVIHTVGETVGVECGSDWCGREFTIRWRG